MGKNSSIEWTDHTFNPWWGCVKVSPACDNCYAEAWAKRVGQAVWGKSAPRRFFTEAHWREPLRWSDDARSEGRRRRVFCASMADVFEARKDLNPARNLLWKLIEQTPWLDWLLLTKRPASVSSLVPWGDRWPRNVWMGTTVEDQKWAQTRLPSLLALPAARRFLSCEPLLGPLDLTSWLSKGASNYPLNWVITGGESGPNSRPMLPSWARSIRDQCRAANVPFHFKQWGHWAPSQELAPKRGVKNFFDIIESRDVFMQAVGKKIAGRALDGATWDELPTPA